jgi:hypothetical protein
MRQRIAFLLAFTAVLWFYGTTPQVRGGQEARPQPTTLHLVRSLKIVPGKQLEFLLWLKGLDAARDDLFYAHVEGADWDWVTITPLPNPERYSTFTDSDLTLKYRSYVAFHQDTFAHGPFTLDELIAAYQRKDGEGKRK